MFYVYVIKSMEKDFMYVGSKDVLMSTTKNKIFQPNLTYHLNLFIMKHMLIKVMLYNVNAC